MDDIQPGQVEQFERPHAEAGAVAQDAVDLRGAGDALTEDAQRLAAEGAAGVGDDQAGTVAGQRREVPDMLGQVRQAGDHRFVGTLAAHHFHHPHQRHRVEEMQPGDAPRVLALACDAADRQRRGVARQHRVRRHPRLQLGEQRLLGAKVLDYGLDQQVAVVQLVEAVGGDHALRGDCQHVVAQAVARGDVLEQLAVEVECLLDAFRPAVVEAHRQAAVGEQLGDAAAHDTGADDADAAEGRRLRK
ncbi:hypothetical protein D9M71_129030 [compost metagenome]